MSDASSLLYAMKSFVGLVWDIFQGVTVPGLGVSFATFWIAIFFMAFSIRILSVMLGSSIFLAAPTPTVNDPAPSLWASSVPRIGPSSRNYLK